ACGEHRIACFRKLIEIAFNQDRTESAETYNLRPRLDRAGRCSADPGDVLVHVGRFQTIGRNKRVDVNAARLHPLDRSDIDMTECSRRNPRKDVLDLIVRQRRMLRSAHDSQHLRSRCPALLMSDQREIDLNRPPSPGYTGNWATHLSVTSPGSPNMSSVFRYCCRDAPRSSAALRLTSNRDGFTQLPWHTSQCPSLHSFASIFASVVITSRCRRYTLSSKRCASRARSALRIAMA